MPEFDDKTERGLAVAGELMGPVFGQAMRGAAMSDGFGSAIARLALDYAFADVWAREGLERKHRSLVVIGVLIASRQPSELKNHIRIAIRNGLTVREIEEALIQTAPYVGFPAVSSASTAIIEVLRDLDALPDLQTPEEKGLL